MSGYQVGLNSFGSENTSLSHRREGYLDYLTWSHNRPALRFFGFDNPVNCDALLGRSVRITVHYEQCCPSCGAEVETDREFCQECAGSPPMTPCVWHPGTECSWSDCPFPEYKRDACAHTFVVYLVAKETVKVGITRADRRLMRWAEQGATHGLVIGECHNRKVAGIVENCLSEEFPTKSDSSWYVPVDEPAVALTRTGFEAGQHFPERLEACYTLDGLSADDVADRVVSVPSRVEGVNHEVIAGRSELGRGDRQTGRLIGIRGSVIATDSFTLNTKRHAGTRVTIETAADLAIPGEDPDT